MLKRGDALARLRYRNSIKIGNYDGRMNAGFGNNFAPWRNDQAVTVGLPATLVLTRLGRRQYKAAVLDGPRAHEHAPMRFARGPRECRGNGQEIGPCLGQRTVEMRKTQIVAHRQAEHAPR